MDEYDARLLDQHLESYFADAEDEQSIGKSNVCHELANYYVQANLRAGYIALEEDIPNTPCLEDDCALGLYVGKDD